MSDMQRCRIDKTLAFVIVTFFTKLPFVICLKEVCFYFPYAKCTATSLLKTVCETELQNFLHFSILAEKHFFHPTRVSSC